MQPRDVKTLFLLEALGKEGSQSQRDLSKKLNISLGLVNSFINNLLIQGVFKTSKLSKNRVSYKLSPKGIVEKAELTRKYFAYSMGYYKEIKNRISKVIQTLVNNGKRSIILYGTGDLCEIACVVLSENNLGDVKIIDDNEAGRKICGITISPVEIIDQFDFDAIIIMDFENASACHKNLLNKGVPAEKIYPIIHHMS